jgi:hypothetical protein
MATSEVAICNSALAKVGVERILDLNEDTVQARLCKEQYGKVRDDLLRSHPWNFAIKRATLVANTTTPAYEFSYTLPLPNDCLRVLEVNGENIQWQKEGQALVSNEQTLGIKYIAQITVAGEFDAIFREVLACKLAYDLSYSFVQSVTLKQLLKAEYEDKLRTARSYDGQEGSTRQVYAKDWQQARY